MVTTTNTPKEEITKEETPKEDITPQIVDQDKPLILDSVSVPQFNLVWSVCGHLFSNQEVFSKPFSPQNSSDVWKLSIAPAREVPRDLGKSSSSYLSKYQATEIKIKLIAVKLTNPVSASFRITVDIDRNRWTLQPIHGDA